MGFKKLDIIFTVVMLIIFTLALLSIYWEAIDSWDDDVPKRINEIPETRIIENPLTKKLKNKTKKLEKIIVGPIQKFDKDKKAENKTSNIFEPKKKVMVPKKNSKKVEKSSLTRRLKFYKFWKSVNRRRCKKYHKLPGENQKEPSVHVCLDNLKKRCNVLSFGIDYNWIFDDYMLSRGCKVWSFDPSMRPGKYKRHKNHEFFPIGLGNQNGQHVGRSTLYTNAKNYNVKTLDTIMKELRLNYVDVIRMDIEGAEWEVLGMIDYSKIGQLLIEVHVWGPRKEEHIESVLDIPMNAFWMSQNLHDTTVLVRDMTSVYEIGFIKN